MPLRFQRRMRLTERHGGHDGVKRGLSDRNTHHESSSGRFLRFRPIERAQNAYLKFNKILDIKLPS
jgi:hypothetical protein